VGAKTSLALSLIALKRQRESIMLMKEKLSLPWTRPAHAEFAHSWIYACRFVISSVLDSWYLGYLRQWVVAGTPLLRSTTDSLVWRLRCGVSRAIRARKVGRDVRNGGDSRIASDVAVWKRVRSWSHSFHAIHKRYGTSNRARCAEYSSLRDC
jgi:hypothetical protein